MCIILDNLIKSWESLIVCWVKQWFLLITHYIMHTNELNLSRILRILEWVFKIANVTTVQKNYSHPCRTATIKGSAKQSGHQNYLLHRSSDWVFWILILHWKSFSMASSPQESYKSMHSSLYIIRQNIKWILSQITNASERWRGTDVNLHFKKP